jgi:hypothetical protein
MNAMSTLPITIVKGVPVSVRDSSLNRFSISATNERERGSRSVENRSGSFTFFTERSLSWIDAMRVLFAV